MDRRAKDGVRAGVTAVGVAAGLLVLASTAQTPDGFIHASFGGPLDVFGTTTSDVVAIGDGAGDATELAALLKTPGASAGTTPDEPFRVTVRAGEASNSTTVNVFPTIDPTTAAPNPEESTVPTSKPAVDAQGKVDCTGSVSCKTDPLTKTTTVTYPDGVIAVVQKVNDLTVVAYQRIGGNLRAQVQAVLPPPPDQAPPVLAAPPPLPATDPSQTVLTVPALPAPEQQLIVPPVDAGPPAPDSVTLGPSIDIPTRPRVNVTRPPLDFGGDVPEADLPAPPPPVQPKVPGLGKVKDAFGAVVDAVKDGIGKAIGPGASGKADDAGKADNPGRPGKNGSGDDTGKDNP